MQEKVYHLHQQNINITNNRTENETYNHHVEVAVGLCIILLHLVLNLTKSKLLLTPIYLFILKRQERKRLGSIRSGGKLVLSKG